MYCRIWHVLATDASSFSLAGGQYLALFGSGPIFGTFWQWVNIWHFLAGGQYNICTIFLFLLQVDKATGRFNGQFKTYAICGAIRRMGEADDSLLRLAKTDSIVSKNF
uniref:Uncharacterized protein n=1 Tax=Oncorhynchus kisutch TaxID=8019 RepID=A0A8C7F3V0_ONCKI